MGYRTDVLLLRPAPAEADPELLGQFGYQDLLLNRDTAANGFFFLHPGCLLTARHPNWALFYADLANRYFHRDPPHQREAAFRGRYPAHRILAISRSDSANFYLYNYSENSQRVRMKMGDHGNGVSLDIGNPLPEEQAYYERTEQRDGEEFYVLKRQRRHPETGELEMVEEELTHDQVGGELAFKVAERIIGKPYDAPGWDEGAVYYEYIPRDQLDRYRKIQPLGQLPSANRFQFLSGQKLLTEPFREALREHVEPLLFRHGFTFEPAYLAFTRTVNGIRQSICFSTPSEIGRVITNINPHFRFGTPQLKEWWQQEFGTLRWDPTNERKLITEEIKISNRLHEDQRPVEYEFDLRELDYEQAVLIIRSYLEDTLLAFFDFHNTLEHLAPKATPLVKRFELLLSLGKAEEARLVGQYILKSLKDRDHRLNSEWLVRQTEERMAKFFPGLNLTTITEGPAPELEWPVFPLPEGKVIVKGLGKPKESQAVDNKAKKEKATHPPRSEKKFAVDHRPRGLVGKEEPGKKKSFWKKLDEWLRNG